MEMDSAQKTASELQPIQNQDSLWNCQVDINITYGELILFVAGNCDNSRGYSHLNEQTTRDICISGQW